jgi:hypothetical protein
MRTLGIFGPPGWPFSNVVFLKIPKNPSDPFSKNENFRDFRTPRLDVLKVVFQKVLKILADLFSKNENFRGFWTPSLRTPVRPTFFQTFLEGGGGGENFRDFSRRGPPNFFCTFLKCRKQRIILYDLIW